RLLVDVAGADRPLLADGRPSGRSVDARRRDLNEPLQLEPRALLEDVLRRLVVDLPVVLVGEARDAELPRHVDGRVGLEAGAPEVDRVGEVALVILPRGPFRDHRPGPVDEEVDLMAPREERVDEPAADEAGPARDEDPHISITRRITSSG